MGKSPPFHCCPSPQGLQCAHFPGRRLPSNILCQVQKFSTALNSGGRQEAGVHSVLPITTIPNKVQGILKTSGSYKLRPMWGSHNGCVPWRLYDISSLLARTGSRPGPPSCPTVPKLLNVQRGARRHESRLHGSLSPADTPPCVGFQLLIGRCSWSDWSDISQHRSFTSEWR